MFIIYVYTLYVKLCEHTVFIYIHRYVYVGLLFVESQIEIGALIKTLSFAVRESFSGTNVGRGLQKIGPSNYSNEERWLSSGKIKVYTCSWPLCVSCVS